MIVFNRKIPRRYYGAEVSDSVELFARVLFVPTGFHTCFEQYRFMLPVPSGCNEF